MLREMVRWSCIAIPTACVLIAVGAAGLSFFGQATFKFSKVLESIALLLPQTLGPIVLWIPLRRAWSLLRKHFVLEALTFPFAVALVGWAVESLLDQPMWPRRFDVLAVSIIGWLGFSWALLAARLIADRVMAPGRRDTDC